MTLLYGLFFLSGAAALLFETLWFRLLGLSLGNSVWASSLVLSGFMAGLALGSGLASDRGQRLALPVRTYAVLEVIVAFTGMGLVLVLPALPGLLAPALRPLLDQPFALNVVRLATAGGLLLVPCTAMGATLPLLTRGLAAHDPSFGRVLGGLYGANTLGALAGAVAGEALIIPALGLRGTGLVAAALNLVAATLALRIGRGFGSASASREPAERSPIGRGWPILLATFLAGGLLLAYEVVWFRFQLLFVHGTSLTFAAMLATVLAGIGLGGLLAGHGLARRPDAHRLAPHLALVGGVVAVGSYASHAVVLSWWDNRYLVATSDVLLASLPLMGPLSLVSGALFTLLGQSLRERIGGDARPVGRLALANTMGAACGAVIGGFVLLPGLGVEGSFLALALGYGGVALAGRPPAPQGGARWRSALVGAGLAFVAAIALFPFGFMESRYLPLPLARHGSDGERLVARREGLTETILYLRRDILGWPVSYRLVTNGHSMSSTQLASERYMRLFVHWPLALRPDARDALLISYGVGSTAHALTSQPGLEHVDVVDISRDVLELSRVRFGDRPDAPLADPRVEVHVEDGRFFLLTTERRYDVITGEPPPPKSAGIVNLYTREHFALIRDRLAPRGLTTWWLPVYQLEEPDTRAIVRAFCDVFEDCTLWTGGGYEWMLAGSRSRPAEVLGTESRAEVLGAAGRAEILGAAGRAEVLDFGGQWRNPQLASQLRRIGFETPGRLAATFLGDASWLRELTAADAPLTDDRPGRLSAHVPEGPLPALYAQILEAGGARERLERSDWARRHLPADVRDRALEAFDEQGLVDAYFANPARVQLAGPLPLGALHALLVGTRLELLPLALTGSEPAWSEAARRADAAGSNDPMRHYLLGCDDLALREYEAAARRFALATAGGVELAPLSPLHALSLSLAGRREEALALVDAIADAEVRATVSDLITRR